MCFCGALCYRIFVLINETFSSPVQSIYRQRSSDKTNKWLIVVSLTLLMRSSRTSELKEYLLHIFDEIAQMLAYTADSFLIWKVFERIFPKDSRWLEIIYIWQIDFDTFFNILFYLFRKYRWWFSHTHTTHISRT